MATGSPETAAPTTDASSPPSPAAEASSFADAAADVLSASDSPAGSGPDARASTDALEELAQEHDAGADVDAAKPTQICTTNDTLTCQSPFFYSCQAGALCCELPCN